MSLSLLDQQKIGVRIRKAVQEEKSKDERRANEESDAGKSEHRRSAHRYLSSLHVCYVMAAAISIVVIVFVFVVHVVVASNADHGNLTVVQTKNTALLRRFPEFGTRAFEELCPWAKSTRGAELHSICSPIL